jgi:hypothetical protein
MPTINIPRNEALDLLDDSVRDEITGKSRWSIHHAVIVKINGKLYRALYMVGATESQDESPWEYESEVTFTEVEEYQKTVTDYRDVS